MVVNKLVNAVKIKLQNNAFNEVILFDTSKAFNEHLNFITYISTANLKFRYGYAIHLLNILRIINLI